MRGVLVFEDDVSLSVVANTPAVFPTGKAGATDRLGISFESRCVRLLTKKQEKMFARRVCFELRAMMVQSTVTSLRVDRLGCTAWTTTA